MVPLAEMIVNEGKEGRRGFAAQNWRKSSEGRREVDVIAGLNRNPVSARIPLAERKTVIPVSQWKTEEGLPRLA